MSTSTINYTDPNTYLYNIKTLQDQLPGILDEFERNYILYKQNPSNSEYQQYYNNSNSNMNNINTQLFNISNSLDKDVEQINTILSDMNKKIKTLKTENNSYQKNLEDIIFKNARCIKSMQNK